MRSIHGCYSTTNMRFLYSHTYQCGIHEGNSSRESISIPMFKLKRKINQLFKRRLEEVEENYNNFCKKSSKRGPMHGSIKQKKIMKQRQGTLLIIKAHFKLQVLLSKSTLLAPARTQIRQILEGSSSGHVPFTEASHQPSKTMKHKSLSSSSHLPPTRFG